MNFSNKEIEKFISTTPAAGHWGRIGLRHHHGICLPLFSLHSNESCGIGEFYDLSLLFRWCRSVGMDVIQLLPLNDTGNDTSPYNALSAYALNPIHLSLTRLPHIKGKQKFSHQIRELQILNTTPRVDYPKVAALKMQFLREYFENVFPSILEQPDYRQFLEANPWTKKYAIFKALKIKTGWQRWSEWPSEWRTLPVESFYRLFEGFESEVSFHLLLQYLCFKQFKEMKEEAADHGVFLKGDIPILISKESADVWGERDLFHTDYSAGVPPDMYNSEGQNWGFPLYNWEEIEKNGYSWWKKRLEVASHYYDIYRLDHIVGFYRIWRIPENSSARYGSFVPPEQWKWLEHGEKILRKLLSFSHMLPIGEDLGTVPPEVRQSLRSLGICGTKVMRWERVWNEDKRFIKHADYEPLSMTTVSTHDSETLKQWWLNQTEEAKEFAKFKGWDYIPNLLDERHFQILRDSHHTSSLFHINLLQEYLVQIPGMTSRLLEDERINLPGVVSEKNWSYRFLPSVEEITSSPELRNLITHLLASPSRQESLSFITTET